MGADGASREHVLAALARHGVEITDLGNGKYELSRETVLVVQPLKDTVSRSILEYLRRQFGGPPWATFYPPLGGKTH